jgi:GntR family transcriptional regulator / MocR family aminotransferase
VLWLRLDGDGPLHRQLYRALRAAILAGRLAPGERLPSTRSLVREVGVSRNTVLLACEQLVAEGYAEARARSGTFVAEALPAPDARRAAASEAPSAEPPLSAASRRIAEIVAPGRATWSPWHDLLPYDFRYGEPSYGDLPLETWTRLLGRRARKLSVRRLAYQAPGGATELREALAGYLGRARGVVATPDQIVIVHGSQQAIDLATRVLIDPGDTAVLEEPHYPGFSLCLGAAGAKLVHVPVDEHGLCVGELDGVAARCSRSRAGSRSSSGRRVSARPCSRTTTTASSASTASRSSACRRSTATGACSTSAPRRSCSSRRCASAGWSCRPRSRRTS